MKDYSAMSDFEINCHVAETAGIGDSMFFSSDESELAEEDPKKRGPIWNVPSWIQVKSWMPSKGNCFNPCNNPADAWPIIIGNLISIEPDYEFIDKTEEEIYATGLWIAEHSGNHKLLLYVHESPLRAAMTVFLMMKGAEKGHG